jgi:hypothetical protein
MLNRTRTSPKQAPGISRDERSWRVLEYVIAFTAVAAAVLLAIIR